MKTHHAVVASLAFSLSGYGLADVKFLRGNQVTESAIIGALTPGLPPTPVLPEAKGTELSRNIGVKNKVADRAGAALHITFETNSAKLTNNAKQTLNVVGQALQSDKLQDFIFQIEGHADPRGQVDANFKLSELRAESVRQYLINEKHIDSTKLSAVGKGAAEPANSRVPAAPENRRVVILNTAKN